MERKIITPRDNWQSLCDSIEFKWHTLDGVEYWRETACYKFTANEIDQIEAATQELHDICIDHVTSVIESGDYRGYNFDNNTCQLIEQSWNDNDDTLYGRFDLAVVPTYTNLSIKMLEYNADTPTSLYEAAVVQWRWLEDKQLPDQFNSIHEKLVDAFRKQPVGRIHFCAMQDSGMEDWGTISYLAQCAADAGKNVSTLPIDEIGLNSNHLAFIDSLNRDIEACFKLYPWEWMMQDQFASAISRTNTIWYEPPWKMLLSTKALLPLLYQKHPNHPNLLQAYFDTGVPVTQGKWIRKPILSREGSNISLVEPGSTINLSGDNVNAVYDQSGYVLQEYAELAKFDNQVPVVGSWIIEDTAAGIGIREDLSVTGNRSSFVPHYFE